MNANHTSKTTKRRRQKRKLLASILAVVIISIGSFVGVVAAKWTPRLGLDLAGGLSVVYQTEHHVSASDLAETVSILNNRVNGLGVSGAQVNTTGSNEITVAIPGLKDPAPVLSAIGQTATAQFPPCALLRVAVLADSGPER
jgi:preprotein translocase subunit SecD